MPDVYKHTESDFFLWDILLILVPVLHIFQLFSIIVFGCVSTQGWYNDKCQYNHDANACGFGTAVGVIGTLGLIGFLVLDAMFENISSVQHRKYVVIGDIGFSGNILNINIFYSQVITIL